MKVKFVLLCYGLEVIKENIKYQVMRLWWKRTCRASSYKILLCKSVIGAILKGLSKKFWELMNGGFLFYCGASFSVHRVLVTMQFALGPETFRFYFWLHLQREESFKFLQAFTTTLKVANIVSSFLLKRIMVWAAAFMVSTVWFLKQSFVLSFLVWVAQPL